MVNQEWDIIQQIAEEFRNPNPPAWGYAIFLQKERIQKTKAILKDKIRWVKTKVKRIIKEYDKIVTTNPSAALMLHNWLLVLDIM